MTSELFISNVLTVHVSVERPELFVNVQVLASCVAFMTGTWDFEPCCLTLGDAHIYVSHQK